MVKGRIVRALTKTTTAATDDNDNDNDNDYSRAMTAVELEDGTRIPADVLVIACGPWTYEANKWFADADADAATGTDGDGVNDNDNDDNFDVVLPEITAIKCHSILVPSATSSTPNTQAVFFDSNGAIGEDGDLEVYPRPDGDSYVNGFANDECVCVERPGEEVVEDDKIQLLRSAMDFVENNNNDNNNNGNKAAILTDEPFQMPSHRDHTQQVCYWPETPDGLPIIGKIPEINGAYVAGE